MNLEDIGFRIFKKIAAIVIIIAMVMFLIVFAHFTFVFFTGGFNYLLR